MKKLSKILIFLLVFSSFFPLAASIRSVGGLPYIDSICDQTHCSLPSSGQADSSLKVHIGVFEEISPDLHLDQNLYLTETQQGCNDFCQYDAHRPLYVWYFRARYFSDELGRFVSRDPLGYVDGYGLYGAYFAQWMGLDPSGLVFNFGGIEQRILTPSADQPIWGRTTVATTIPTLNSEICRCFFTDVYTLDVSAWVRLTYEWNMRDPLDGTITRVDMTRTAENIQRTTQHELEHVESWREFHDEWAPRFEAITSEYYAGQPDECADLQQRYQALLNEYVSAHAEHVEHNDHHHEFSGDIRTGVNLQTGEEVITGTY